jgi:ribosomal protein L11 methyltransferase
MFELRGTAAEHALDLLHVHTDVQGAIEGDGVVTVWFQGELPPLPFPGLVVRELPFDPDAPQPTGLEHDAPILVATDLLVRPPWVACPNGFRGVELVVPRGGAFGSGEHDSTQAALRCLHEVWDAPASFGDVGTGSGILALYAQVRGCRRLAACDIDPASVAAARELLPTAIVTLGGAATMPRCDGVVANMTAAELTASMPAILRVWTRRNALVLSGLRAHEVAAVAAMPMAVECARATVGAFTAVGYRGAPAAT